ncbi:hypothetical protein Micbo1qcDRAFT_209941 [Microdochium bolleyi]|uniref:Arrestin-like N-terminal domain-containing protein n=1 Tax=Microdochium bolleyi TaxID=196109 RepID=A0A136IKH0_9PEZI|nr:hypothetical protein Micbo1qcDRAFT_209941 [Microdochium bolleyi]
MTLGTVIPSVVLHKPDHVHCGPADPVEGHVRVKWMPKESTELFGPAKIHVTLHGRIKVRMGESNKASTLRTRVPLFSIRRCIHDGPLRIQPRETQNFPFQISFPSDWRWAADGRWKQRSDAEDKMYSLDPNQPLPPSMTMRNDGLGDSGEALIQYCIEIEAGLPNLDVSISTLNQSFGLKLVLYERPRMLTAVPPQFTPSSGTLVVRDRCLVPEAMRPDPHGFRQRASAMFRPGPKPQSVLEYVITTPKHVHKGQPLVVAVRCHQTAERSTTPETPELRLLGVQATAEACRRSQ